MYLYATYYAHSVFNIPLVNKHVSYGNVVFAVTKMLALVEIILFGLSFFGAMIRVVFKQSLRTTCT